MLRQVSTIAHKITFAFCTQFEAFRLICNFQLETSVLSVDRAKWKPAGSAKKAPSVEGFEVVLEDTVLFPEGGGQGLVDAILHWLRISLQSILCKWIPSLTFKTIE